MEFNNLYGLSGSREFGMHGSEGNLEQIIDWKMGRKEFIQKGYVMIGGSYCSGFNGTVSAWILTIHASRKC